MRLGRLGSVLLALLVVGMTMTGGAAAVSESDDGVLVHEPDLDTTDSTDSVWVEIAGNETMNGTTSQNVTIMVEGLNESEDPTNGTTIHEETVEIAENSTESYEYALSEEDLTNDSIHVHVTVPSAAEEDNISSVDYGTFERIAGGGGGGGLGGSDQMYLYIGIAGIVGLLWWRQK